MSVFETAPKTIFFDWDGTLVDSFSTLQAAHDHVRKTYGLPDLENGWFHQYFGRPRDMIYSEVYGESKAEEARTRFEEFFRANHCDLIGFMDGASGLLAFLKDNKIKVGIVSNKKGDFVRAEIRHLGLESDFITVVSAGEAEQDKPSPAPLLLAMERTSSPKDGVWYVGDSVFDFECSKQAGVPFVFLGEDGQGANMKAEYETTLSLPGCSGFKSFLAAI